MVSSQTIPPTAYPAKIADVAIRMLSARSRLARSFGVLAAADIAAIITLQLRLLDRECYI